MGLDTVELVVNVEKRFDIAIPDREATEIVTVQDLADCVRSTRPIEKWSKKEVERIVVEIVSEVSGIPADEIKLSHNITSDLGLD